MSPHNSLNLLAAATFAATLSAAAGQAAAQPNLSPVLNAPMNASVGVQNTGTTASGPSHLTINCTKFGQADGGCPDAPGMGAYVDPAFPNRVVIDVPALEPGESYNHNLSFWASIPWTPGTYVFDAVADAGNDVAESNEANNESQSSYTQLPAVGVAPQAPLPLTAGTVPARPLPGQKVRSNAAKQMMIVPAVQKKPRAPQRLAPAKPVEPKRLQLRLPAN
jgi:hypothetical protein